MSIRWKLLISMLCISILPLLIVRWINLEQIQRMGNVLETDTRNTIVKKAEETIKVFVKEHIQMIRREKQLIEIALELQVAEFEKRLHQEPDLPAPAHDVDELNTAKYFRVEGDDKFLPLDVSFLKQTIVNKNKTKFPATDIEKILPDMWPAYYRLQKQHSDLFFWHITSLQSGAMSIYPSIATVDDVDLKIGYFLGEPTGETVTWSEPIVDPFTDQLMFVASSSLRGTDGSPVGVTAIAVPVRTLLRKNSHIFEPTRGTRIFLVRLENLPETGKHDILFLAHEHLHERQFHHWHPSERDNWVKAVFTPTPELPTNETGRLMPGAFAAEYEGEQVLAVLDSIDNRGSGLMFITPLANLISESIFVKDHMMRQIGRHITVTRFLIVAAVLSVVSLALIISRSFSHNIKMLVRAHRQVSKGKFATRIKMNTKDELSELGHSFNQMVPALEEHMFMKQALEVAMEIQQSLLPGQMPQSDFFEIAGTSLFCDELGGDYFDFMDFCCRVEGTLGVAVGDVAGHGIPAALLMISARGFLRCRVTQPGDSSHIISDLNFLLSRDTQDSGSFMTLFYLELNPAKRKIEWIRAGHDPAFLYDPGSGRFDELKGFGLPLGVTLGSVYVPNFRNDLKGGQIICIATDGLWETMNSEGHMFGKERLKQCIHDNAERPAQTIMAEILSAIEAFRMPARQTDDVTLVVIKVTDKI